MDIDVARHTVRKAFQVSRELGDTLLFLKEKCGADEYQRYAVDIATAIHNVQEALLNRAIETYPDLKQEIDEHIAAHGRYL